MGPQYNLLSRSLEALSRDVGKFRTLRILRERSVPPAQAFSSRAARAALAAANSRRAVDRCMHGSVVEAADLARDTSASDRGRDLLKRSERHAPVEGRADLHRRDLALPFPASRARRSRRAQTRRRRLVPRDLAAPRSPDERPTSIHDRNLRARGRAPIATCESSRRSPVDRNLRAQRSTAPRLQPARPATPCRSSDGRLRAPSTPVRTGQVARGREIQRKRHVRKASSAPRASAFSRPAPAEQPAAQPGAMAMADSDASERQAIGS